MSELKGQLLSVLLVVAIFSAIGAILVAGFQDAAKKVVKEIDFDSTGTVKKVANSASFMVII